MFRKLGIGDCKDITIVSGIDDTVLSLVFELGDQPTHLSGDHSASSCYSVFLCLDLYIGHIHPQPRHCKRLSTLIAENRAYIGIETPKSGKRTKIVRNTQGDN